MPVNRHIRALSVQCCVCVLMRPKTPWKQPKIISSIFLELVSGSPASAPQGPNITLFINSSSWWTEQHNVIAFYLYLAAVYGKWCISHLLWNNSNFLNFLTGTNLAATLNVSHEPIMYTHNKCPTFCFLKPGFANFSILWTTHLLRTWMWAIASYVPHFSLLSQ